MPVIPKSDLTMVSGGVPRYAAQQMLPGGFNVGNSIGSAMAGTIGNLADDAGRLAKLALEENKMRKAADEKLAQVNEDYTIREMMIDAQGIAERRIDEMKRNPDGYGSFPEMRDNAIGEIRSFNEERYNGLSDEGKRRYDLFSREFEYKFTSSAEELQYQANVSHMLARTDRDIDDALSKDSPDFGMARDTVRFQEENGLVGKDAAEARIREIDGLERLHSASSEMREDPAGFMAKVREGGYGDIPAKDRTAIVREAQAIMNKEEESLMDSISVMMAKGEEIPEEMLSSLHDAGRIGDRNYAKLLNAVKAEEERKAREARAEEKDAEEASKAEEKARAAAEDKARKDAEEARKAKLESDGSSFRRKVYGTRWSEDPIERGRQFNDLRADILERFSDRDRTLCNDLIAYAKQTAYPEKAANPMLVRQYEQEFGEGPDRSLLSVSDPERDGKWWRDSRGNEDEVAEVTGALFDMAMRRFIDLNPDATVKDLRDYSVSVGRMINSWTIDDYAEKAAEAGAAINAVNAPSERRRYDDREGTRWMMDGNGQWGVLR